MIKKIPCPDCGTKHVVNTEKHVFREKLCTNCRAVIDNAHPKRRVLSVFQRKKEERKAETRQRFVQRMLRLKHGMDRISKMMTKVFGWEKKDEP